MPDKVSPLEFAESVKKKYPEYRDYDNIELTNAIIKKYPEYKEYVNMEGPLPSGPKPSPVQSVPTFQEQLPTMQGTAASQSKYTPAVARDKSNSGKLAATIYNGLVGSFESLAGFGAEALGELATRIPTPQYDIGGNKLNTTIYDLSPEQQVQAKRGLKKSVREGFDVLKSGYVTKEEEQQLQGKFDLTNGIGLDDFVGLTAMSGRMLGDVGLGVATGGASFAMQAYSDSGDEYDEAAEKMGMQSNPTARMLYATTGAVINGLLEKYAIDKIVGSGPIFKSLQRKALANVLKNTAGMTGKAAIDAIQVVANREVRSLVSSVAPQLRKAGYRSLVEGGTEGFQTLAQEGAKVATNWVQGQEVFDQKEIKDNLFKNVLNSAAAGLVYGPIIGFGMDKTFGSQVNMEVLNDIANAKTPEDFDRINKDLEQTFTENNFNEEERAMVLDNARRYAEVKQTLPEDTPAEAQVIAIPKIEERIKLDNEIQKMQSQLETVDESLKNSIEQDIAVLQDKRAQINDEVVEAVTGQKFEYIEDNGKFFKKTPDGKAEEITESRYNLEQIKLEEDAIKKGQGPIQEGGTVSDIGQRQGTQEGGAQKAPIETNLGDSNLGGEEISVKSLIGRRVTYQGVTGTLFQEGQTLSIETPTQIREIGNVDELSQVTPESIGIESEESLVEPTENGFMVGADELFNRNENPLEAISRDQNGKVMNVVLTNKSGKRRKFRGAVAEDLAYQITLKQISNEPEFEAFLEQNADEINAGQVQEPAQEGAARPDEQIPTVEGATRPATEQTVQPTTEPTARPTTEPSVTSEPAFGKIVADQPNKIPRGLNRLQRKVVKDALRVVESIIRPVQDLTGYKPVINLHNQATFTEAVLAAGGRQQDADSRGFYLGTDGTIHLNMDNLASDTMLHEGFHPILDFLERYNPEVINNLFTQLESIEGAAPIIAQARANYDGDITQKKEAITDFVAGVADGRIVINPNNFQKIRKFILDMLNKIGIGKSDLQLMDVENEADLIELANFVTEKFREGENISRAELEAFTGMPSGYEDASGNPIQSQKIQFSVNNDFSDVKTKTTFTYIKNKQEFEDLKKAGYITEDQVLDNFVGKKFMLHAPDNAFTGEISKNGKTIIEGKGGVFYPIRFHNLGYFWASTKTAANTMANKLNQMIEQNGGKIYMALVSSPADKLLSSTTASNGVMEFFASSALDSAVGINKDSVVDAIYKAAEASGKKKVKNNKGVEVTKIVGLRIKIPKTKLVNGVRKPMTLLDIQAVVSKKLGPENSTFDDRKLFSEILIKNMVEKLSGTKSEQILGRFLDKGILNTSFKQQGKIEKKYKLSAANVTQSLSEMLSEPMLKGSNTGQVYAVLEIEGKVKPIPSDKHESYPTAIVSEKGGRTKVHILQERENWNDRFANPDTGVHVEKKDMKSVFPTSGVSNEPLMLLAKKEPAFQRVAPNGQPSKLNAKQYEQVRTPEFKAWFGDWENDPANASKVVDENGEPRVVFHGTYIKNRKELGEFDTFKGITYFTDNDNTAFRYPTEPYIWYNSFNDFVKENGLNESDIKSIREEYDIKDDSGIAAREDDPFTIWEGFDKDNVFVYEAFLNIKNPKEVGDAFKTDITDVSNDSKIAVEAKQENKDGIIGTYGAKWFSKDYAKAEQGIEGEYDKENHYIIFDPNQIKSATENVGTFSTQDNRIQFQKQTPTKDTRKPVEVAGMTIISSKKKATIDNLFTSSGPLGPAIRTFKEQMGGELTAEVNIAERTTKEAMKLMEKYKGVITTQDVENFLSGNATPSSFPLDLATKLTEMRAHVDRLTDRLLDLNVIEDKETRQLYMNNKGKYMLRSYELFRAKGPVTVKNVTKKLKNVDQSIVDAALAFLEQDISSTNPNLTPQEVKDKAISMANGFLSDKDMAFGGRPIDGSVNTKSISRRSQYLDDSPAIRALMGEYTDPMYKYYSSIFKLANITSHRAYLNNLKKEGMGKFLFTERTGEATEEIAGEGTKSLAPLGGLYTFPEIRDALMVAEREQKNLLEFLAGHVRMMKTVYNPATHVKNLLGSMAFAISNGHWMYLGKALSLIKKSNRAELIKLIDVLNREGVLNNNIGAGEINQYFDKFESVNDILASINNNANSKTTAAIYGKAKANLKKIPNALKKAYALEDDIFKILGFVNETNLYARAEYKKDFDALSPDEKAIVIKEAAERVKSFYPTFSRVPKFVKKASKALFLGNFLSFPVESVRVSYNTISQGVKEARSSNPKIQAIGINRLVGTILYNGAMTWLLTYSSMAAGQGLSGLLGYIFDDEDKIEEREKAKKFRTSWNKDSQVLVSKFSDGKLVYSDMGSIDSYGYQREVWNTFWDNMSNKEGFNKSMAKTIAKTVEPFLELDMTVETIMNIMNGRDEFGNEIVNSEAPYNERLKGYTKYISSKFSPGVINSMFKAYRLHQEGDDDAVINEALSQLVRTYTVDLEKSFTNYVYANPGEKNTGETGFKKRLDNAESIYNRVKNSRSMSDSEKESYYQMAVEAYKNVLRDVSGYYQAAVAGGVDPNKLNQILISSKLADQRSRPELNSIIQNRYDFPDEAYIRR